MKFSLERPTNTFCVKMDGENVCRVGYKGDRVEPHHNTSQAESLAHERAHIVRSDIIYIS